MASVLDSFKEILDDKSTIVINLLLTIPIFYTYVLFKSQNSDFTLFFYITSFLLILIIAETANFYITQDKNVFHILNPLKLILMAFQLLLGVIPVGIITVFLTISIINFINIEYYTDIVLKTGVWIVSIAIILTSFLSFIKDRKILNAYNVVKIFKRGGDTIGATFKLVLCLLIFNAVTFGVFGYILYIFFKFDLITVVFICYAVAFNVSVIGHHLAQM